MESNPKLPLYKKKVYKSIPFHLKSIHKRKTSNFTDRDRISHSLKLQRLLFSRSKCQLRNNILIDKRIGENSYELSEEEKQLDKFSFNLRSKQADTQINLLPKSNCSFNIATLDSPGKFDDLLQLKNCSSHTIISYEKLPEENSNNDSNLLKEVETQWQVMKYTFLPESRNDIGRYPNSYDVILGDLTTEERTKNFCSNLEIDANNVNLNSSSDKDVNHDISKINRSGHFLFDFSEKLARIESISDYQTLSREFISSLRICKNLMENIFYICDQLIESLFTNRGFFVDRAHYVNHVYSSLYEVLTLHSKFTLKYLIMRINSLRHFNKLSTNCKTDEHKSILLLYFLLSLIDIGKTGNYPIVKFGITAAVEILSNCYNLFNSDAGSLILLIEIIISISLVMRIFVPEVYNFLTSFIALYTKSSQRIRFPPFSYSPCNNNHSEFQLSLIDYSPDQIAGLNFFSSNFPIDQLKFNSLLLQFTLELLSRFFKAGIKQFSYFGIPLSPLIINLKLLQKRLDLPICSKNLVHALLEISRIFGDKKVKLGLIKKTNKSLKFLDMGRSHSSRIVNRVFQDNSKQIHKFTRTHKRSMMKIRKDSSLFSLSFLRQQLFNDQIRKAQVTKLRININRDI